MTSLRVLTYHRVATPDADADLNPRLISATPDVFEEQMRRLRRRHAVVPMAEVLDAVERGTALPRRAVLLTFDDAYADLADHAIPILETLKLPATLFVPTAFPDHPERSFRADRLHRAFSRSDLKHISTPMGTLSLVSPDDRRASLRLVQDRLKRTPHAEAETLVARICEELGAAPCLRKSVLSWNQLRELARNGFAVAAHSRNHAILTRVPIAEVHREAAGAREDLLRELGLFLPVLCYPNGSHDDAVVAAVRDEGYRVAFTTRDGGNDLAVDDPLRLRRTSITRRTTGLILRLRMTPLGARFDSWRHRNTH